MGSLYYRLNPDHTTTPITDMTRANWSIEDRLVGRDTITMRRSLWDWLRRRPVESYDVSTVFLVLDHAHSWDSAPVLFETMIFGPDGDDVYCTRYETWDEAEAGHDRCLSALRAGHRPEGYAFPAADEDEDGEDRG